MSTYLVRNYIKMFSKYLEHTPVSVMVGVVNIFILATDSSAYVSNGNNLLIQIDLKSLLIHTCVNLFFLLNVLSLPDPKQFFEIHLWCYVLISTSRTCTFWTLYCFSCLMESWVPSVAISRLVPFISDTWKRQNITTLKLWGFEKSNLSTYNDFLENQVSVFYKEDPLVIYFLWATLPFGIMKVASTVESRWDWVGGLVSPLPYSDHSAFNIFYLLE